MESTDATTLFIRWSGLVLTNWWYSAVGGAVLLGTMAALEKFFQREFHLSRYVGAYVILLVASSFVIWREEHLIAMALRAEVDRLLTVDVHLYERYPHHWGNGFTDSSEMKLDGGLPRLVMKIGQSHNFTPTVKAPERLALENVQLFVSFPKGIEVGRLERWTVQSVDSSGTTISQNFGRINQGGRLSTDEMIPWRCPVANEWLPIQWAVTAQNAPRVTNMFLIDCRD